MSDKNDTAAAQLVEAGWRRTSVEALSGPLILWKAPDGGSTHTLGEALVELEQDG